jgi:hypothetical protein
MNTLTILKNELDGHLRLRALDDVVRVAGWILELPDLDHHDFKLVLVSLWLCHIDCKPLTPLTPLVDTAFERLPEKPDPFLKELMFDFHASAENWQRAREFLPDELYCDYDAGLCLRVLIENNEYELAEFLVDECREILLGAVKPTKRRTIEEALKKWDRRKN